MLVEGMHVERKEEKKRNEKKRKHLQFLNEQSNIQIVVKDEKFHKN
jgi:hypothetical protein